MGGEAPRVNFHFAEYQSIKKQTLSMLLLYKKVSLLNCSFPEKFPLTAFLLTELILDIVAPKRAGRK